VCVEGMTCLTIVGDRPQAQPDFKPTKKTDHPGAVVPARSTAFHLLRSG